MVSVEYLSCTVQDSVHYNMDIGMCVYVTLCIGQLHPIAVYRTFFLGGCCSGLSVIMCYFFLIPLNSAISAWWLRLLLWILCPFYQFWTTCLGFLKIGSSIFFNYASPWVFLHLDILFEHWIECVTFELLYVMFRFSTRVFYRGVQVLQLIVLAVLDPRD